jgi:hypothetical protein
MQGKKRRDKKKGGRNTEGKKESNAGRQTEGAGNGK